MNHNVNKNLINEKNINMNIFYFYSTSIFKVMFNFLAKNAQIFL